MAQQAPRPAATSPAGMKAARRASRGRGNRGGNIRPLRKIFLRVDARQVGPSLIRRNPREAEVPSPSDVGLAVGALEGLTLLGEALSDRLAWDLSVP